MQSTPVYIALAALIGLAACDPKVTNTETDSPEVVTQLQDTTSETAPETEVQPSSRTAEIDWDAAKADYQGQPDYDPDLVTTADNRSVAVPVLLPEIISTASGSTLDYRPQADGYYAIVPGETYDMVINGTNKLSAVRNTAPSATDTPLRYEETLTGAQVSFSRYGASYLVEFACKNPDTPAVGSCVSEADALAATEELLIRETR